MNSAQMLQSRGSAAEKPTMRPSSSQTKIPGLAMQPAHVVDGHARWVPQLVLGAWPRGFGNAGNVRFLGIADHRPGRRSGAAATEAENARPVGHQPHLIAGELQADALPPRTVGVAFHQRPIRGKRGQLHHRPQRAGADREAPLAVCDPSTWNWASWSDASQCPAQSCDAVSPGATGTKRRATWPIRPRPRALPFAGASACGPSGPRHSRRCRDRAFRWRRDRSQPQPQCPSRSGFPVQRTDLAARHR